MATPEGPTLQAGPIVNGNSPTIPSLASVNSPRSGASPKGPGRILTILSRRGRDGDGSSTSPRRRSDVGQETANLMLSPVLSRAMEQHREGDVAAELSNSMTAKRQGAGFKATAQALNALAHPVHMPSFKGGEGIRRLVEAREKDKKFLGLSVEYWDISLFSFKGRAWPMLPQLIYLLYSTATIAAIIECVPKYQNVAEMKALQFPIQTMGLALFLLLAFRTNSAYDRWWEGRKLWDGLNAKVQDIARIAMGWVASKEKKMASGLIRWSLAFAIVAKRSLRAEQDFPELAGILSEAEIEQLQEDIDPVSLVANRLTELVCECAEGDAKTPAPIYNALDNDVRGLNMDLCACHRILSTPTPLAQTIHLRSFMVLWLLGLPFAFVVTLGWWSILVCTVVGYELLGFETISVEIENPFGRDYNDLPLDLICTELFVKLAGSLGRLGHSIDMEAMICSDPLREKLHHTTHYKSLNLDHTTGVQGLESADV